MCSLPTLFRPQVVEDVDRELSGFRNELGCFTYSEHLGTATRAYALGRRSSIFHGDLFGVFDLLGSPALDAVSLHINLPP